MRPRWLSWTARNLARSREEHKPILLSISATWCHYCHEMDQLTYQDKDVIQRLNTDFIPIRVDTDERPDVNSRYNTGGWPTTAVLNGYGKIIGGAQYLDPEHMHAFLDKCARLHAKARKDRPRAPVIAARAQPIKDLSAFAHQRIEDHYDPVNKGFGTTPKIPDTDLLDYLLQSDEQRHRTMLVSTLLAMAHSELHDTTSGGFHRYCTKADWTYPHFEKLVLDNALLLDIYTRAFALTKKRDFRMVAKGIVTWLNCTMWNGHAYKASQAADEEYCRLTLPQRKRAKPPYVDDKILTDANANAARALLTYARTFKHRDATARAHRILDTLLPRLGRQGAAHSDARGSPATLGDTTALLTALRHAGLKRLRDEAPQVERALLRNHYDTKTGGLWDLPRSKDGFGLLGQPYKDFRGNMHAVRALSDTPARIKTLEYWTGEAKQQGAYCALYELNARHFL